MVLTESDSTEANLVSSANDVWGALFAATSVFPKAIPHIYESITSSKRDGFSQGSIRTITYSPEARFKAVKTVTEEIMAVDHEKRTVKFSVTGGELTTKHYDTFDTTITVSPLNDNTPRTLGCKVSWTCEYTNASGTLALDSLKEFVRKTFLGLDTYLQKLSSTFKGKQNS